MTWAGGRHINLRFSHEKTTRYDFLSYRNKVGISWCTNFRDNDDNNSLNLGVVENVSNEVPKGLAQRDWNPRGERYFENMFLTKSYFVNSGNGNGTQNTKDTFGRFESHESKRRGGSCFGRVVRPDHTRD